MTPRRAFTLLEVTIASMVGGLVLITAVGFMGMMTRTDEALSRRATHEQQFEIIQRAVSRAVNNFVMSDAPIDPEAIPGPDDASDRLPYGINETGQYPVGQRPRLMLQFDASPAMAEIDRRARQSGDAENKRPQRFEMFLRDHPVPLSRAQGGSDDGIAHGVRGAFELRIPPQGKRPTKGLDLWWVPLGPDGSLLQPQSDGQLSAAVARRNRFDAPQVGIKLASGLLEWRWRVFYNRERLPEHSAIWAMDLPAYIELRVRTTSGLAADWLFEIGWTTGPEGESSDEATLDLNTEPDQTPEDELPGGDA